MQCAAATWRCFKINPLRENQTKKGKISGQEIIESNLWGRKLKIGTVKKNSRPSMAE